MTSVYLTLGKIPFHLTGEFDPDADEFEPDSVTICGIDATAVWEALDETTHRHMAEEAQHIIERRYGGVGEYRQWQRDDHRQRLADMRADG